MTKIERPALPGAARLDSRWSWATGSARTWKSTRRSSGVAGRRLPEPRLREPPAARPAAPALDQLFATGPQPAAFAGDLPAVGWLDQGRIAMPGAADRQRPGGKPCRSPGWATPKVNWSRAIGFWYYIFGEGPAGAVRPAAADHQPEQPRTDDPRLGHDRRGLLPRRQRPRRRGPPRFRRTLLAALEPILPEDRAEYFIP